MLVKVDEQRQTSLQEAKQRSRKAEHPKDCASKGMAKRMSIFDEQYRVVAVEGDRLLIKGEISGTVLVIVNPQPESPLSADDYPLGKLIALTDPSAAPLN